MRSIQVSGFVRNGGTGAAFTAVLAVALAVTAETALHAQTQLSDPKDAPRIFASTCSACHKSPQGPAKSGQVAGFLRQHYTTGPEMSAAMAAYLVAAGSAPAEKEKKGPAAADASAAKSKSKKGEQLAAQAEGADAIQQRTLRGKQRAAKEREEAAAASHAATPAP